MLICALQQTCIPETLIATVRIMHAAAEHARPKLQTICTVLQPLMCIAALQQRP